MFLETMSFQAMTDRRGREVLLEEMGKDGRQAQTMQALTSV